MYTNLEKKNQKSTWIIALFSAILLIFSAFLPFFSAKAETSDSVAKIQTEKNLFRIAVIGDSLAYGYERGFTDDSKPFGVGEQIFEQALFQGYRAEYANYGINGLTSSGLLKWLNAAQQNQSIKVGNVQAGLNSQRAETLINNSTGQLKEDLSKANLIVLAIGGNDFLKILTQLDLSKAWKDWTQAEREELEATLRNTTTTYIEQLSSILEIIHTLNKDAAVVTQNQYLPLPKFTFNGVESYQGIDGQLAEVLNAEKIQLNKKFDDVLANMVKQGMKISAIDASAAIESNATGLTGIVLRDPHPNATGYKKLVQQYSQLIWNEYKTVQPRKAGIPLSVVVDGKEVISPYPTKLINGRTYLVLRDITDAMGADLKWNNKTQTATITYDNRVVELTIGSSNYKVNGVTHKLNAEPAFLAKVNNESKTYVPVAAISEGLDFFVHYQAQTKTVFVNK